MNEVFTQDTYYDAELNFFKLYRQIDKLQKLHDTSIFATLYGIVNSH